MGITRNNVNGDHLMIVWFIIILLLALFWSPTTPEKSIWQLNCQCYTLFVRRWLNLDISCWAGSTQRAYLGVQGCGIMHAPSMTWLPGTLNRTEPSLTLSFPPALFLLLSNQNVCSEKGLLGAGKPKQGAKLSYKAKVLEIIQLRETHIIIILLIKISIIATCNCR